MSNQAGAAAPIPIPAHKKKELAALTQPPFLAWPTAGMWAFTLIGVVVLDAIALSGQISLWLACGLNIMLMYPLFGVIHDATHRAISNNAQLNDWIGRAAVLLIVPHATLGLFRWAHIQHHRFTNGPNDPDQWVHGAWWTLPFRWATYDLAYLVFIVSGDDTIAKKHLRRTYVTLIMTAVFIAAVSYAGYGTELLVLWLIPSRITIAIFGFVFFWLPHVKDDVSAQENLTLASSMRLGNEWLLDILLQYHNYHLIHHLYPATPPYNHRKIWKLMESEIRERDLAIQFNFDIQPTICNGSTR